jgi:hypothetical protein
VGAKNCSSGPITPSGRRGRYSVLLGFLLIAISAPLAAHSGGESLTIRTLPGEELAVRAVAEPVSDIVLLLAGRSRSGTHRATLGLATDRLVAGPLTQSGLLAELGNPTGGGPMSPRWLEPAAVSLDRSLVPTSRVGIAVAPVGWARAFACHADDTWTAGVVLTLHARAGTVDMLFDGGSTVSGPLPIAGVGFLGVLDALLSEEAHEAESVVGWFDGALPQQQIVHGIARGAVAWRPVDRWGGVELASSSAIIASVPRWTLPGLAFRSALAVTLFGSLEIAALAILATPDFRTLKASRPASRARVRADVRWDSTRLRLGARAERAYSSPEYAFRSVAFGLEHLRVGETTLELNATVLPPESLGRLRSAGIDAVLELPPEGLVDWRIRADASLRACAGAIESRPSVELDANDGWSLRLRLGATVAIPWLERTAPNAELSLTARLEWAPGWAAPSQWGSPSPWGSSSGRTATAVGARDGASFDSEWEITFTTAR